VTRSLRAVEADEQPAKASPRTIVEAAAGSRRELMVALRNRCARELDVGVPAHTLARLVAEIDRLDGEIRKIDDAAEIEVEEVPDGVFDYSAI